MLGRIWMAAEFIAAFYIILCTAWVFYAQYGYFIHNMDILYADMHDYGTFINNRY